MAARFAELEGIRLLTNSDAHSLPRIGREVNLMRMEQVNFRELVLALKSESGRGILANYGVWPALGRYFRSYCESCDQSLSVHAALLSGGGVGPKTVDRARCSGGTGEAAGTAVSREKLQNRQERASSCRSFEGSLDRRARRRFYVKIAKPGEQRPAPLGL